MDVYLRAKFEVSSIILTGFRQGEGNSPPPQDEPLKIPFRVGLTVSHYTPTYILKELKKTSFKTSQHHYISYMTEIFLEHCKMAHVILVLKTEISANC